VNLLFRALTLLGALPPEPPPIESRSPREPLEPDDFLKETERAPLPPIHNKPPWESPPPRRSAEPGDDEGTANPYEEPKPKLKLRMSRRQEAARQNAKDRPKRQHRKKVAAARKANRRNRKR